MEQLDNTHGRKEALRQVESDLDKNYRWLLVDVHEELLHNDLYRDEITIGELRSRPNEENVLHAQKRLASLQVRIAESADNLQRQMRALTIASVFLSIVAIVIAPVALLIQ